MYEKHASVFAALAAALILGFAVPGPASAMTGYAADQVVKGTVQDIDYLHHAITVNGQTYAVSPQAKFSGIAAFSVLHIGMPIQFMLTSGAAQQSPADASPHNQPRSAPPQVITQITWLPGGV